jgi:hypothetical protein
MLVEKKISAKKVLVLYKLASYAIAVFGFLLLAYFSILFFHPSYFFSIAHDLNKYKASLRKEKLNKKISPEDEVVRTQKCETEFPNILLNESLALQFKVYSFESKPFSASTTDSYLIGLKDNQKKLVQVGESVFIEFDSLGNLNFSDEKTNLTFKLRSNLESDLYADVSFQVKNSLADFVYEESIQLLIYSRDKGFYQTADSSEIVDAKLLFNKAKFVEPDLLIQMYGGKSFDIFKKRYRLFLESKQSANFIQVGDVFYIEDQNLVKVRKGLKDKICFRVDEINTQGLKLRIWSKDGLESSYLSIPLQHASYPEIRLQDLIKKLQKRSDTSLACMLDGRNFIFKQGDWILINKGKFKNLKNTEEINQYLGCFLKGELFIFDGIKKTDGREILAGHLFNDDRSMCKKVEIVISEKKNNKKISNKSEKSPHPKG